MKNFISNFIIIFSYCFLAFTAGFLLSKNDSFNKYLLANLQYFTDTNDGDISNNITIWNDKPEKSFDGYILLSSHFSSNPAVILVNKEGTVKHKWSINKKIINNNLLDIHEVRDSEESSIHSASDMHLYPNGDLLLIQEILNFENLRGNQITLIDKDSKVKWQITGQYHHEFNVADNGNIYSLNYAIKDSFPEINIYGQYASQLLFLHDTITEISPDGKILREINIPEAFANSEFKSYLNHSNFNLELQVAKVKNDKSLIDVLHVNSAQYIDKELSQNIEQAQEGDFLISLRGIDALALLRPSINQIVWLQQGIWKHQHHVQAQKDGTILIYDNEGASRINVTHKKNAYIETLPRVLSFNMATNETKEIYNAANNNNFNSFWKGSYVKLSDNSYLVSSAEQARIRQVSSDNSIIWELRTIEKRDDTYVPYTKKIPMFHYYTKQYPNFLQ